MAIGVLIEALLGGPSTSTTTSGGTRGDKNGGAREWIKNKLKALSQIKAVTSCSTHKIDQQESDG